MDRQGWPGTMVAAVKTEDTNDCTQFKVNDTVDGGYRFQLYATFPSCHFLVCSHNRVSSHSDGKIMLSPGSGDRSHWVWMDQATRDNWNSPDTLFTPKLQGGNEGSGNAYYVLISGSSNSPIYAANDRGFLNDKGDGFKICVEHIATD